jgi:hypothetical protein
MVSQVLLPNQIDPAEFTVLVPLGHEAQRDTDELLDFFNGLGGDFQLKPKARISAPTRPRPRPINRTARWWLLGLMLATMVLASVRILA